MRLKVIGDEKECTLVIPADKVIKGDVDLSDMGLTKLPDLSAVIVNGNFDCMPCCCRRLFLIYKYFFC